MTVVDVVSVVLLVIAILFAIELMLVVAWRTFRSPASPAAQLPTAAREMSLPWPRHWPLVASQTELRERVERLEVYIQEICAQMREDTAHLVLREKVLAVSRVDLEDIPARMRSLMSAWAVLVLGQGYDEGGQPVSLPQCAVLALALQQGACLLMLASRVYENERVG